MAEYAGYVQRAAPIDWSMVAEDIITKLGDVEKDKAAFREKYDTMASDLYKELGDYEAGKSQSFNEFVYNGIASGRTTLAALHERLKRREISPDDFNRATMSMSSQMDDFKKLTTHYNEAIANTQKGIDDKKLSGLSVFASERLASIADFKNKNLQWMPNQNGYTNLYINSLDKNGNIVGDPTSVTSLVTPGNLEYKRTDVAEETKRFTSELGKYKKDGINDAKAREGYKKARTDIVNSIVNDANSVASILYEYGNYTFYEEGQPKPKGKSLMVKVDDNHMLVPDVDPQNHDDPAVKEAREIVENIINQQVDYEETPPKTYKPPKETPPYTEEELAVFSEGYNATWSATTAVGQDGFKYMDTKRYNFDIEGDGTITVTNKDGEVMIEGLERGRAETAKALAPYYSEKFGGTGWQVIHKQQQRPGTTPGKVERDAYNINAEDLEKVGQITKMNQAKGTEAFAMIEEIITDGNPQAKVDFVGVESAGRLADNYNLTIKVGDKEYKILIDEGVGEVPLVGIGDSYNEVLAKNKEEITKAINESLGVNTNAAP
jgi:hypothetical protein